METSAGCVGCKTARIRDVSVHFSSFSDFHVFVEHIVRVGRISVY